jgi:hypothetical protein
MPILYEFESFVYVIIEYYNDRTIKSIAVF